MTNYPCDNIYLLHITNESETLFLMFNEPLSEMNCIQFGDDDKVGVREKSEIFGGK